ncbi:T9SS type A sorting domain-containing protein, partial [Lewinella sp. W8]|uniref:T9SS type A sorting domain-containing protein n=1 Tax=Lewinella sp. W8 TaxID=2528208 RepID=UPI0012B60708
ALRIRAGDGCGNFDVDILEFCVTPDKAPTPICIQTLTVTLMPTGSSGEGTPDDTSGGGMAAIWATDFIASDVTDCFGNVIDKYSIYTEEEATEAGFAPAVGRIGIDLTCEDFGEDVNVRVYAIDNAGNADYCSVVLEVQAFQDGLCDGNSGMLTGAVATQDDDLMGGVEVTVTGANDMDEMVVTNANGQYAFSNLELGGDYTAQPAYNAAFDYGEVTVTDIVAITSHILGTAELQTGYDYVAADVTLDSDVNIFDLVAIRRVILGLDDELNALGLTWRFVEADYNLTPGNWMTVFPEVYNVNNLQGNVTDADFVGVELGNVLRSGGRAALELTVDDAQLAAGQAHTIELSNGELAGFQGTLELAAGLELLNVTYEGEGALNLNRAGEGMIAMAFTGRTQINLEVRATEDLRLSEVLRMTDAITYREGTAANGGAGELSLHFGVDLAPASAQNKLLQNTPNPVSETTVIRFELAQAGPATLTLRDAAGRRLLVREIDAVAGSNQLELSRKDLGASGVVTYTLESGDFTATKKMVIQK